MSTITDNQRKANLARAEDAARKLVEALRYLPMQQQNEVLHTLVEWIELEDRSRPVTSQ